MSKFMKTLNNISRSQALYRNNAIADADLQSGHYSYVLAICRKAGCSQEELADELLSQNGFYHSLYHSQFN